jgi:uncharacterized membrane protein (DUF4010 family)
MLARSLLLVAVVAPAAFQPFSALVLPGLIASSLGSALLLYLARKSRATTEVTALEPPGLRLALLFAVSVAVLAVASAWAQTRWGDNGGATLIAIGGLVDIDAAIAAVGALPAGTLSIAVSALALAAPTLFNTLFKLALFVAIAGWRQSLAGGFALAATAVALGIPIAAALL